jgi:hypothetical protein
VPNVVHIHARVGFEEGPQVNDPRAPEWKAHVEGFENWWQLIWKHQRDVKKYTVTSVTPEQGPFTYQPCIPYTLQPLADIWEVNNWIGDRMKKIVDDLNKSTT